MTSDRPQSTLFETISRDLLAEGMTVRFTARGASMSPAIRDGEVVHVKPTDPASLRAGDIVLINGEHGFRLHRLVMADAGRDVFITRGDCGQQDDSAVRGEAILGMGVAKEVQVGGRCVRANFRGFSGRFLCGLARGQKVVNHLLGGDFAGTWRALARSFLGAAFVILLAAMTQTAAQVAVDATTSGTNQITGTGTGTVNFNHTTTATANRLLIVGVSINITNSTAAAVTGVTYNTTSNLSFLGAHNDAGNTRRVEMWYLPNPTSGTNLPIVVTVNVPTGGTVGVVAGATTFTGVDQSVPLGTFVSADGAGATNSQLDVPSVVNGMVLDTLATGGNRTITVPGPQVSQWNANSSATSSPGVRGVGTSRAGAPSVPVSETFSNTSNWSLGAVSINPTTADVGVSTSAATVFLGSNTTYNITVTNNGPSAANTVVLTDTWPTANLSTVSITPSAGTSCSAAPPPITCTLPTPFASGATATVAVVVTASASGAYPNTATVTDSGTPPDPNTGNNTYIAVATVQSVSCATVSQASAGTPSGVVNTYYPGTAGVAAGATSIPLGTATGAGTGIVAGDLLLVIQMQDASINTADTVAYGNGSTGQGFTALNSAGNYEFVTATNSVGTGGGTLTITGAGAGGGLVFSYDASAATATKGQSTYQVILVPQYTTAVLPTTGLTASAWNGSTGGVLAIDTSSTLNLNGATVSVDGLGFRGGAGMQLVGSGGGSNTDYWQTSPATYTGAAGGANGVDGSKGEGIAGTPLWVESGGTFLNTNGGYPSGTAGVDGSMARGAPGNAGGGGTDADPVINDQNAGGGGGGNGGAGGFGGDSWNTNLSVGGEGGAPFPATINRIAMGGGGGAGTRNNSDGDNQASSGSSGGGIIIIRAYALTGTATLTANGSAAYNGTANDAGGGGGAGGTIVVLSANGGESGLSLLANGGRGGNAWQSQTYSLANRHGPGGGGGGGVVMVSGAPASISVAGGGNGLTLNPGVPYGATPGAAGVSVTNASLSSTSGTQSGAQCTPDMTLGKSHVGNFTRGTTASYTVPVSNLSPYGASSGAVTVNDSLPVGLTPTSASGTGWACSVVSQTVSCVRSDSLAAASSYPSLTITANVQQSAPATVTNTAIVAGGSEINLANDTATDVANVVSSADLSITNTASPNPVAPQSGITYTQVVTNNGPSAADNATLVANIPANTTYVSMAAPPGWSCVPPYGNGNVVCTNSNMPGSTVATFTLVVRVNTGTANGTVISETASVSSSVSDPNVSNNTATATTIVGSTAGGELTVTNSAAPNPVIAGNNITYTQVVTNTGSGAATTATFSEATPANTTFVSIAPPAGWTCTGFPASPCTNPSVAAGSSGTFSVVYNVTAGTASGTVISDTVTVNAANQAFGANSATATDVVAAATQADLALTTVGTPPAVIAGNDITYTQTIQNNGPATATSVQFTEAIPANTTFVSVSAPAGWTCTNGTSVTCTIASLAAGASANIVVAVNVASTVTVSSITANSSVSSSTSDPSSANNSTTVTTGVSTACDLSITNSGTPSPVAAGSNITYTQTVTNSGPSNCAGVTFTENFPANTTFVSLTPVPPGWTCTTTGSISCTNPSVAPGTTATFPVVVKVAAGTAAGTIITDTATGATTTHDTNLANNSATVTIAVASGAQADLSVTNAGSPNPVTAGNNITYTQTVKNGGPATANAPVFTETLPANTTGVSLTGPAGWTCVLASLTCTDTATMAANTTANFTFVVKVNNNVAQGSTITQTDSVSSTTSDPTSANNSATVNIVVGNSADLSVTNVASPVPVLAGTNITYTQVVTNPGPSVATSASFTETTPPNTNFRSVTPPAGWSCVNPTVGSAGTITCTNPSFAPGTASFTVVLQVNAGTASGTAINDTVTVSSSTTDPNLANNSATAADLVATGGQADLVTTNSAAPTSVAAGSNVTYTQSVTNDGPAAATSPRFTQSTPPNTNFQSITPPAGWTCLTVPPVGGTGTITCTDGSSLGVNATANFTLVLQVNAGTPSGTNIAETVTASATNIVPNLTTNSATAVVVVANAGSADMAIVKTAAPNPVAQGDPLTYTLAVTNNGPSTATNVTVTDSLPTAVTYLSVTTTQGACSEAGGTVTCLLGSMANAGTATVTIVVLAGTPGIVSNTATVSADQTDPNPSNNSSTQTETITAPTGIRLQSFTARTAIDRNGANQTLLTWKTGGEAHNLGFNVYRDVNGDRVRLNPSLIAGSALLMRGGLPKHAAKPYAWIDSSTGAAEGTYWLEDVDVDGTRTLHGPIVAANDSSSALSVGAEAEVSPMFGQKAELQPPQENFDAGHTMESAPQIAAPTSSQLEKQFELAAHRAVKIQVQHEGWYRVTQPELLKAGLDPNVDPTSLKMYVEAQELPIKITGATPGRGGFGPSAAVHFYGTGIDTPFSDTRVYWLVAGDGAGSRMRRWPHSSGSNIPPSSFMSTVELRQRTTYFAALPTPDGDNFFGELVPPTGAELTLNLPHLDTNASDTARIEVVLQGAIVGFPHRVTIAVNGTQLGETAFTGQEKGRFQASVPRSVLLSGANNVELTAQNGIYDISLVDSIRIEYPHLYVADSDQLKFSAAAGDQIKVSGFENAPRALIDITDPSRPVQLSPTVRVENGRYEIEAQVPWSTTNSASPVRHTLLAVADDRIRAGEGVMANHPSRWHSVQAGANIVMITYGEFAGLLTPLVRAHRAEGKSSAVVPVTDLYDEFNFGEHSPYVMRAFLQSATQNWKTVPTYLLLNGRASFDPRNYLGFGNLDLVPTKIVPTSSLVTASDDWFSDFSDSGMPTMATGRLPVSTAEEAETVVAKIAEYEGSSTNGPWTSQALVVADRNDTESFTQDSQAVQAQMPSTLQITDVFTDSVGAAAARQQIVSAINSGQLLVNYLGHGSEAQWSGADIFDAGSVTSLTNGPQLPVFLIMDCLNGIFQDAPQQPLAVTLLLAPNGGAVGVLASSGLNQGPPQAELDKLVVKTALHPPVPTLGDAILQAKSQISDGGVRKTYVLLGDPAMTVKLPQPAPAAH